MPSNVMCEFFKRVFPQCLRVIQLTDPEMGPSVYRRCEMLSEISINLYREWTTFTPLLVGLNEGSLFIIRV